MTAYLQPGDKIHIAVGINSTHSVADANQQTRDQLKTFEEAYGAIGVSILTITGTPGLLAPVIVAVIREPAPVRYGPRPAGSDDLIPRRYRSQDPPEATERPRAKEFLPHGLLPLE